MKSWKEKCAVFGAWADPLAGEISYLGLYAQQHRGQEAAGIVSLNSDGTHHIKKGLGLVGDVFHQQDISELKGQAALGHLRYATSGKKNLLSEAQPLTSFLNIGPIALAHNGHFTNGEKLLQKWKQEGFIFQGTNDTECLLPLLSQSKKDTDFIEVLKQALKKVEGAYSLLILTQDSLLATRDPFGFRPLVLGYRFFKDEDEDEKKEKDVKEKKEKRDNKKHSHHHSHQKQKESSQNDLYGLHHFKKGSQRKSVILASETCAFDLIGAEYNREIEPGEIYLVNRKGERSFSLIEPSHFVFNHPSPNSSPSLSPTFTSKIKKETETKSPIPTHSPYQKGSPSSKNSPPPPNQLHQCIFEHVYFARPDSIVFGLNVYKSRKNMGKALAKEDFIKEANMVVPVPDSGISAALGYSQESQIPFELGVIRNHYVGRTFIQSHPHIRHFSVKVKLNPHQVLLGKKVIVIDDSLVRGTTAKQIIQLIRQAGAKEIHFRLASPPIISPCYYGIDTPQKSDLISSKKNLTELKSFLKVDSLQFLSLQGLLEATQHSKPSEHSKSSSKILSSTIVRKNKNLKHPFCTSCFSGKYPTPIYPTNKF